MIAERIEASLQLLPADSTLYCEDLILDRIPRFELLRRRFSQATLDPGYAWAFVMEFVKRKLPLPAGLHSEDEQYMTVTHQYQMGHAYNGDLMQALAFHEEEWRYLRGALQAALLDRHTATETIAKKFNVRLPVVQFFERLFFAIRDRFNDLRIIHRVVAPMTRAVELNPNYFRGR